MAEAAIEAGCDAYFGYPITPQAELLEWMARRMPELGRVFVQAESELARDQHGASARPRPARASSSPRRAPGISLMAEAMSYMAGSELPHGPDQRHARRTRPRQHRTRRRPTTSRRRRATATATTACRCSRRRRSPRRSTLIADAFEIAERYRTPVMILRRRRHGPGDGAGRPGLPDAASASLTSGQLTRRRRPAAAGRPLAPPPARGPRGPQRAPPGEVRRRSPSARSAGRASSSTTPRSSIVAYGTAARVARTAIERAREQGLRAGLFRPISLWPFPSEALAEHRAARAGDRRRRDVGRPDGRGRPPRGRGPDAVFFHGRTGGMVPTPGEVVDRRPGRRRRATSGRRQAGRRAGPAHPTERRRPDGA